MYRLRRSYVVLIRRDRDDLELRIEVIGSRNLYLETHLTSRDGGIRTRGPLTPSHERTVPPGPRELAGESLTCDDALTVSSPQAVARPPRRVRNVRGVRDCRNHAESPTFVGVMSMWNSSPKRAASRVKVSMEGVTSPASSGNLRLLHAEQLR